MDTSIQGLIGLLVWLLLGGLVVWLAVYLIGVLNLPSPFRQIVLAIAILIAIIVILNRMGVLA